MLSVQAAHTGKGLWAGGRVYKPVVYQEKASVEADLRRVRSAIRAVFCSSGSLFPSPGGFSTVSASARVSGSRCERYSGGGVGGRRCLVVLVLVGCPVGFPEMSLAGWNTGDVGGSCIPWQPDTRSGWGARGRIEGRGPSERPASLSDAVPR